MMKNKNIGLLLLVVMLMTVIAGCSTSSNKVKLAYVAWDSEIASTYVLKEVLETKLGANVEMIQVDAGPMWAGLAKGSVDGMVSAWLPNTHAAYLEKYGSKVEDLGPNLKGTKVGLAVPAYMEIHSIEDLKNSDLAASLSNRIIGIEPGAGIMTTTEKAIAEYGLSDYTLLESSSAAMAQELQKAYDNKEPIVVTGWTPHWMFAHMDLKYLQDPKGVYGADEQIHTMVREGLKEDMPNIYKFLDQFDWTAEDMAQVMVEVQDGETPDEAAKAWVKNNPEKVNAWVTGVEL